MQFQPKMLWFGY